MWDKMETPTIVYDLDTSGGLMEVRLGCSEASVLGFLFSILVPVCALTCPFWLNRPNCKTSLGQLGVNNGGHKWPLAELAWNVQLQVEPLERARISQNSCELSSPANPNSAGASEVRGGGEAQPEVGEGRPEERPGHQPRHLRQLPGGGRPAVLRPLPCSLPPPVLVSPPHVHAPVRGAGLSDGPASLWSNPPLSEEMLPPGEWMCHRCSVRKKKREQKSEQTNGLPERPSKRSASPAVELELHAGPLRLDGLPPGAGAAGPGLRVAQVRLLDRRTSSRPSSRPGTPTSNTSSTPTPSEEQNDGEEEAAEPEEEVQGPELEGASLSPPTPRLLKRPFQLLIAAAMERNPTQFQLPSELTCTTALPGSSKRRRKEELLGKPFRRPQHELDSNGLVPLPVKVCFSCNRSCRLAPLVQCDYCPLLFHMDCLDPPLTALPAGKWMCPNHVEHLVLNQRNLSLTSRCQLFDQFQDRMSQHAVKLDFLRRVHRKSAPKRRSAHQHAKKTLKVSRSRLLPPLPPRPHPAALGPGSGRHQVSVPEPSPHAAPGGGAAAGAGLRRRSCPPGVAAPHDGGRAGGEPTAGPGLVDQLLPSVSSLSRCLKDGRPEDAAIELDRLDADMIKLLAWQRIQQLFPPPGPGPQTSASPPAVLPDSKALAPPPAPALAPASVGRDLKLTVLTGQRKVQARAVFYPLTGRGQAVDMCYRTLYIGSGADMDVCLSNYGHCNYISGKHACIFYDENTKHYELLNYSEHGTTVDNVLYSCDFSEKASPSPPGGLVAKVQGIIRRSKKREEDGAPSSEAVFLLSGGVMASRPRGGSAAGGSEPACGCKASGSSLIGGSGAGWEGTALLHHGSYIKLGCLQFVFSVTEFASQQPKEEPLATPGGGAASASSAPSVTTTPPPPSTATASSPSSQDEADAEPPPPHQVPVALANSVP
ncbi:unnamed protein product [Tetraodon nigroviridis]|uniref:(spotted green pufferfish) hypothetical protein n=1 Tax=Tetraodon nigroviridis TaxID=99883 RepID=Q4T887_TETNG|nr:unnamed protein product [Tetraodon nigroviridis]